MALRARKPTGEVAFPMVLIEGTEKAGKSYAAFSLSASDKVGRTFVFDWGEGSADEYAALGRYEVVDHNGTHSDFIAQLRLATQEPDDGRPNVVVIDSVSVYWDALKDWTTTRARRSKTNQRILAQDPDAEINVPSNYWNDANDRWGAMIHLLRTWPGIALLIARGKDVSKMKDGAPVAGQTEWKVEAQKALPSVVTAIVRVEAPKRTRLMGARSVTVEVPEGGLLLPEDAPLEHAIFDVLGAGQSFAVSPAVVPQFGRTVAVAKRDLLSIMADRGIPEGEGTEAARKVWAEGPCASAGKDDEVSDMDWAELEAAAFAVAPGEES